MWSSGPEANLAIAGQISLCKEYPRISLCSPKNVLPYRPRHVLRRFYRDRQGQMHHLSLLKLDLNETFLSDSMILA